MTALSIVPECYVDTRVTELLGINRRYINHQHGSGDVANQLQKALLNRIALGLIDEDPKKGIKSKYFSGFVTLQQVNNLILKRHKERHHYLVLVCPEMETWLLNEAQTAEINLEDFQLSGNLAGLKNKSKLQAINKHSGFTKFIKELIARESPGTITLQKWLYLFMENDLDKLQPAK